MTSVDDMPSTLLDDEDRQPAARADGDVIAVGPDGALVRYGPTKSDLRTPRARRVRRQLLIASGLLPPALLLLWWQLGVHWGSIDPRYFPAPSTIWTEAASLLESGELFRHIRFSSRLILIGFAFGASSGVLVGLLLGRIHALRSLFNPLLLAAFTIPKLAVFPLLLLVFGIGDQSKLVLVGATTFLFVVLATADAVAGVPEAYINVARACRASRPHTFLEIVLPHSLPQIFTSLRLSMGIAILVEIAAEFVASQQGVGYLIWNSWTLLIPSRMYVGIIVTALMGVIAIWAVRRVELLVVRWEHPRSRR